MIIHGIITEDRSLVEINSVWLRIVNAFSPAERIWFYEVLQGNSPEWKDEDSLPFKGGITTIEATELIGTGIKPDKFLCKQSNGVLAIAVDRLDEAIDYSVKRKLQYFGKRYGVSNSTLAQ